MIVGKLVPSNKCENVVSRKQLHSRDYNLYSSPKLKFHLFLKIISKLFLNINKLEITENVV